MLILIVIALIIALFILNRVATRISKPIVELAGITNAIKEGKYKEIVYPDVGNRQDEVAILTRSFQDMVVGLQEKEKIRTLLNKVVSKDIAEEILKNDVHLGGEDRIISILFADIRNFTEITSQFPPQKQSISSIWL